MTFIACLSSGFNFQILLQWPKLAWNLRITLCVLQPCGIRLIDGKKSTSLIQKHFVSCLGKIWEVFQNPIVAFHWASISKQLGIAFSPRPALLNIVRSLTVDGVLLASIFAKQISRCMFTLESSLSQPLFLSQCNISVRYLGNYWNDHKHILNWIAADAQ